MNITTAWKQGKIFKYFIIILCYSFLFTKFNPFPLLIAEQVLDLSSSYCKKNEITGEENIYVKKSCLWNCLENNSHNDLTISQWRRHIELRGNFLLLFLHTIFLRLFVLTTLNCKFEPPERNLITNHILTFLNKKKNLISEQFYLKSDNNKNGKPNNKN